MRSTGVNRHIGLSLYNFQNVSHENFCFWKIRLGNRSFDFRYRSFLTKRVNCSFSLFKTVHCSFAIKRVTRVIRSRGLFKKSDLLSMFFIKAVQKNVI